MKGKGLELTLFASADVLCLSLLQLLNLWVIDCLPNLHPPREPYLENSKNWSTPFVLLEFIWLHYSYTVLLFSCFCFCFGQQFTNVLTSKQTTSRHCTGRDNHQLIFSRTKRNKIEKWLYTHSLDKLIWYNIRSSSQSAFIRHFPRRLSAFHYLVFLLVWKKIMLLFLLLQFHFSYWTNDEMPFEKDTHTHRLVTTFLV